jgi:hypothetical protein
LRSDPVYVADGELDVAEAHGRDAARDPHTARP